MRRLSAKPLTEVFEKEIAELARAFESTHKRKAKLTVILVGEDPASQIYVSKKGETAKRLGLDSETILLPKTALPSEVAALVRKLNFDPSVDGILIQRPLPETFREDQVMTWVDPIKDVDAFHPYNVGLLHLGRKCVQPCTPSGVMELLRFYQIEVSGKIACVVGRSSIVGKPMGALLLQADATVIQAHSKTPDLAAVTKQADILVVAAGKPEFIKSSHIKPGATVIDVGIHRKADGKICGDVDFEDASKVAGAITPVPGGVGPMTIVMLLRNTLGMG